MSNGSASSEARLRARRLSPPLARSTTTAPFTRSTPTSCGRAIRRFRCSTRSTASATAARSPLVESSPSSTDGPSSISPRRSTSTNRTRAPRTHARRATRPTGLPTRAERFAQRGIDDPFPDHPHPLDHPLRHHEARSTASDPLPPVQQVWFRADGTLPDNQVLHTCLLTYASDMTLLDTTLLPHGTGSIAGTIQMASLDHAMWFHGDVPGRRVAALRPAHPRSSTGGREASPPAVSSPTTAA